MRTNSSAVTVRAIAAAVLGMFLAVGSPLAQTTDKSATAQATTSPVGMDSAALAGSARASKVIGAKVYKGDAAIGQIEDVLITLDHATVTAVVLSVGGFLGMHEKLVAVPVNQIKVSSEARFTTELTKEQLASAPAFDFGKLR
jgi:sporulation protein YlmC with PRC-barrel domain